MNKDRRYQAFTLIELLVVIAIIAILAAILFPVFTSAKESARISQGVSNGGQLVKAFTMYSHDNGDRLPLSGIISRLIDHPAIGSSEWQEAIYRYVKSPDVYKVPGDMTKNPRPVPNCAQVVSQKVREYSATSFLTNFNVSFPVTLENGLTQRSSHKFSDFGSPAQFILLVNGQRPTIGGTGSGLRFQANPPDHNGDQCSLWIGIYSMVNEGGVLHIFNPYNDPLGSSVPHYKRGAVFVFLDGHTKFVGADRKS